MAITISTALRLAATQLTAVSDVARLEAEILLAHVLQAQRSYLHAWPDKMLTPTQQKHFSEHIQRRAQSEPVAYITGQQEFWSLDLCVTPDTLIPRPETELLVELALAALAHDGVKVVADLGTGSGAIALALAHEQPTWEVHAVDSMPAALAVAKRNAERLGLTAIQFHQGDWCSALPRKDFDAILSNPPYVPTHDPALEQAVRQTEPLSALLAGEDGLQALKIIIQTAINYLKSGGYLFLEHGYQQAEAVQALLSQQGYQEITSYRDLAGIPRVTVGRRG